MWLAASLIVVAVSTVVALRQTSRPDPYDVPQFPSLAWWKTPVETNAHTALPFVGVNLNAVTALPGGKDVWIAGDAGVILHSADGGETWEREAVRGAAVTAAPSETPAHAAPQPQAPTQQKAPPRLGPPPASLRKGASLAPGVGGADTGRASDVRNASRNSHDDSAAWELAAARPPSAEQKQVPAVETRQVPSTQFRPSIETSLNPPQANPEKSVAAVEKQYEPNIRALVVSVKTHGWAVGDGGVVLNYDGSVWARDAAASALSAGISLTAIRFSADGARGWAVGGSGLVLAYAKGTWTIDDVASSLSPTRNLLALWLNAPGLEGWAAGEGGLLLRLKDGVWSRESTSLASLRSTTIRALSFNAAGTEGWAAGDGGILAQFTRGTWSQPAINPVTAQGIAIRALALDPMGDAGWAAGDDGNVLRCVHGAWRTEHVALRAADRTGLSAVWLDLDGTSGWLVGASVVLQHTPTEISHWIRRSSATAALSPSVQFVDDERGWAITDGRALRATTDGGATWWTPQSSPLEATKAVDFLDASTGWVVGLSSGVAATSDGGEHWSRQPADGSIRFSAVDFVSPSVGWAVGDRGIVSTTNGGTIWKLQSLDRLRGLGTSASGWDWLTAVQFVDATTGWAAGTSGTIVATADGGETWIAEPSFTTSHLRSLAFINRTFGWVVGDEGVILGTTDGGARWNPQTSGTREPLETVQFIDPKIGWAAGGHGTILATRDGGATWVQQPTGTRLPFVSLKFDSARRGIAVAANLAVHRTENGGLTWEAPRAGRTPAPWYYLCLVVAAAIAAPAFWPHAPLIAPKDSVANMLVSDRPLQAGDRDHLQIGEIAAGLSRFLRNDRTEPPLTIAVTGAWGSGKSSLMNLMAGDLVRAGFPTVWFNAWHHQKEEHLLGALLDTVRLQAAPPFWKPGGLSFRARLLYGRWRRRMPIVVAILVAFSLSLGYYRAHPDQWDSASQVAGEFFKRAITSPVESAWDVIQAPFTLAMTLFGLLVNLGNETHAHVNPGSVLGLILTSGGALLLATAKGFRAFALKGSGITDLLARLLGARDPETAAGAHNRFAEEFRDVTTALKPRKLLVNIDDLDRCGPEKVAEVLEAVNFLVSSGDCYVVVGMEPDWVRGCVGLAYKDVAAEVTAAEGSDQEPEERAREKRQDFARQYLEKLINVEVPIPPPSPETAQQLVAPPDDADAKRRRDEQRVVRLAAVLPRVVAWSLALLFVAGAYVAGGTLLKPIGPPPPPVVDAPAAAMVPGSTEPKTPPPVVKPLNTENQGRHPGDAQPAFVSGAPARRQVWPVWAAMGAMALLLTGVWRSSISGEMIVQDSKEFSAALLVWQPLVSLKGNTPRAIKRFLNRVRYYAMSQRGGSGVATATERILARILPGAARLSGRAQEPTGAALPEELLVAWSALSYVYAEDERLPSIEDALTRLAKETRLSASQLEAVRKWSAEHEGALRTNAASLAGATSGARFIGEKTALGGSAPPGAPPTSSPPPGGKLRSSA